MRGTTVASVNGDLNGDHQEVTMSLLTTYERWHCTACEVQFLHLTNCTCRKDEPATGGLILHFNSPKWRRYVNERNGDLCLLAALRSIQVQSQSFTVSFRQRNLTIDGFVKNPRAHAHLAL